MNPLTQFKKIPVLPLLIVLAVVALASPPVARADAVTDWNAIASNAIVVTAGQLHPFSVLHFAMVQGAVYDAVNAIDRGHQPYLVQPPSNPTDSKEAAAATAAFRVLVGIFPGQLGTLQPIYDAYITGLPDNPPGSRNAGVAIGEATAAAMLEARMNDGRFGPPPALYPPAPGVWRPTPPNFALDPGSWLGNVLPFLVPSAEMLRTDGPNALTSAAYAEDFNEVKEVGSLHSMTRTADETDAAIFWQDQAFALWNRVFRALVASQQLAVLASDHGDSRGQHRRRPGHRGRPDVAAAVRPSDTGFHAAAARHAALPRPPIGPQLHEQCNRAHAQELLRHRQDRLQRLQQQIRYHAELRPVLARA
jgi:hypothetical protein